MLLYHPYKDSNHCIFRMLTILSTLDKSIELEKLRILDFYYIFPHFIKEIDGWPRAYISFKKIAEEISEPFENTPNKKKLFFDLNQIQSQAIMKLCAREILSINLAKKGIIKLEKSKISEDFMKKIEDEKNNNAISLKLVSNFLSKIEWKGKNGLKKRTGLMEYKYDE
ncbi:ABC-three component system middle component 5 [Shewanella baltica]|uniref:ABC-three component system middle component 5 n=1 Tax=Shewanella baltica TaxID=62322 RepID=UPI00217D7C25|nr:ABC-three component system middle component 5 [Shewanella baltica]MCS6122794.1 hypothetical protein [Shewanella baltica]